MITAHTDVVGSLLRPVALRKARDDWVAGRLNHAQFKSIEDRAVDEAVSLQEAAGLDIVTDGEMRRLSFQSPMTEAVDGFGPWDLNVFLWGHWHGAGAVGERRRDRPVDLGVVSRLVRKRHLVAEEFVYLRRRTSRVAKVTLPSPSLFVNFWSPERSQSAYASLDHFLADVVAILRDEVAELVRLGATYVQIDAPHYPLLLAPATGSFYESRGWTFDQWLSRGIELDNAVMAGFAEVTFAIHLCRGNQESRWLVAGDYEPIARPIFQRIHARGFSSNTTMSGRARLHRCGTSRTTRRWFSDWSAPSGRKRRRRKTSFVASRKQAASCRWNAWRSALSAALPLRSLETTFPSRMKDASSRGCAKLHDGYGDSFVPSTTV